MLLATPVLPPEASAHANAGRLVPGGVGGLTGGAEMRGPDAEAAPVAAGVGRAGGVGKANWFDSGCLQPLDLAFTAAIHFWIRTATFFWPWAPPRSPSGSASRPR